MTQKTGVEVGKWVADKRHEKRLSQEGLVLRMGNICSRGYIGQIEKNIYPHSDGSPMQPDIEIVEALAEALNVPVNEMRSMFGYPPDDRGLSEQELTARDFGYALGRYHAMPRAVRPAFRKLVNQIADTLIEIHTANTSGDPLERREVKLLAGKPDKLKDAGAIPGDIPEITLDDVQDLHRRKTAPLKEARSRTRKVANE